MKLAEALVLRSDAQKRYEQLRARAVENARYQEGEEPTENAAALVEQALEALVELEGLIGRINATNASTTLDGDRTITDGIAERDVLRLRHSLLSGVADGGAGVGQRRNYGRQLRSELRFVSGVQVDELRRRADDTARQLRELDLRIQQRNWEVDLVD